MLEMIPVWPSFFTEKNKEKKRVIVCFLEILETEEKKLWLVTTENVWCS